MTQTVRPFLMFTGHAEEAMNFHISHFPDARILNITRYAAGGPGVPGTIMKAEFSRAAGSVLMALGNYGFSRQFTWLNDRCCVSWQLNLD